MNARIWKLAAAVCLVASACKQDSGHDPAPPAGPTVTVSASATSVVADGVNTVTITATDGSGSGPINLTASRGTFASTGTASAQIAGGTGSVDLVTCDASTSPTCAGTATVTATGPSGTGSVGVVFGTLAVACSTSCSAAPGCAGSACALSGGGVGTCSSTSPSICASASTCIQTAPTESSCSDGTDNDCNGKIDCEDAACAGQQCGALATSVCKSGACVDLTSGLSILLVSPRTRLPADGTTSMTLKAVLLSGTDPVPNLGVTFTLSPAGFGTLSSTTGTSDLNGNVFINYTAPAAPGVATITATVTAIPTVYSSVAITMPRLGSLQIPDPYALHPVMGVVTSGWNEFSPVMVQVLDDQGLPYPDGLDVRFEHRTLGGSTFAPPLATTALGACTAAAGCVAYDGAISSAGSEKPDSTGLASAPLLSGSLAGTLVVSARTTASGVTRSVTLPSVAVVGAKANLANFSIQCSPRNVPALAETDCATSWVEAPIYCAALMKDRFNNLLGVATPVIFASETAAVGVVSSSEAYDPTKPNTDQPDLGTATQIFKTLGAGLPFDVDPQPGEQFVSHNLDHCGTRTHNPRDGVATLIAIVDGEEAFFDANGNGQYDLGEPFVDQGEPFVDQNDNGQWDPGEWFLDVDGSKTYTPGNGTWDAQTKIWTQTVVVYTGMAAEEIVKDPVTPTYLGTRWMAGYTPPCTAAPLAPAFSVKAKVNGTPPTPPTSATPTRYVVASDMNLNFLTSATTYGVAVEPAGKVKVNYGGLASYADMLGFFYQYWPCDQAGNCASQCRATGANAPCVMKPAIYDFSCGVAASVGITGGDDPDGTNYIDFIVDVPWNVYLGAKVQHSVVTTSGTNN